MPNNLNNENQQNWTAEDSTDKGEKGGEATNYREDSVTEGDTDMSEQDFEDEDLDI